MTKMTGKIKYLCGAKSLTAKPSDPIQILYPPRRSRGRIALSTAESLTRCCGGYFDRRHSCTTLQQNNVKAIKTSHGKPINAYAPSRHKQKVKIVATTHLSSDMARLTIKQLILRASLGASRITLRINGYEAAVVVVGRLSQIGSSLYPKIAATGMY